MARPRKDGLEYFSHDCDASHDEKIEGICALYGFHDGYSIVFRLYERIYRAGGRLKISAAETMQILANSCARMNLENFEKFLESCINLGIFDKKSYSQGYLTSRGIQKRTKYVVEKRVRMRVKYTSKKEKNNKEFLNNSCGISAAETPTETPQSKVKESKVKYIHPSGGLFDKFWQAYPRKEGRKDAEEYFLSNISEDDVGQLIRASENYSRQVEGRELRYVKVPVNFLQVWKDFIPKVEQSDESSTTSPYAVRYEKELYLRIKGLDESELQDFFDNLRTPGTVECEMLSYLGNEAKEKFLKQIYKQSNFNVREKTIQENTMQVIRA